MRYNGMCCAGKWHMAWFLHAFLNREKHKNKFWNFIAVFRAPPTVGPSLTERIMKRKVLLHLLKLFKNGDNKDKWQRILHEVRSPVQVGKTHCCASLETRPFCGQRARGDACVRNASSAHKSAWFRGYCCADNISQGPKLTCTFGGIKKNKPYMSNISLTLSSDEPGDKCNRKTNITVDFIKLFLLVLRSSLGNWELQFEFRKYVTNFANELCVPSKFPNSNGGCHAIWRSFRKETYLTNWRLVCPT